MGENKIFISGKESLVLIGNNFSARDNFYIRVESACITIGENVFINNYCSLNCLYRISIGDNTIIGENFKVYDHNHKHSDHLKLIKEQGFSFAEVNIGHNCWIGSNVVILKGVSIGDNTIIGANCLIYKSIPANSIVKNNSNLSIRN